MVSPDPNQAPGIQILGKPGFALIFRGSRTSIRRQGRMFPRRTFTIPKLQVVCDLWCPMNFLEGANR
jgi:hypothetical protein